MKTKNIGKILLAIFICELAGMIGAIFTTPSIPTWYAGTIKPTFSPPNWVFAPVWTTLFALMGIAAYLIYEKGISKKAVKVALNIFVVQLVLNTLWSIIFFGMHNHGLAFIEIIFLWLAILLTIIVFFKISKPAAYLLIPYILWVSFASFLNFSIWQLNSKILKPVACTIEAKLCPDGSYVGRTGPKCEFAPCPVVDTTKSWKTFTDTKQGISFKYPENLSTTYIHLYDWPPKVTVSNLPFVCNEGGSPGNGYTYKRLVNGQVYCLNIFGDGAAGSIYNTYTYTFTKENKTITLSFTLQDIECGNYDDPKMTACEHERQSLDLDSIVDTMAQSIQLSS